MIRIKVLVKVGGLLGIFALIAGVESIGKLLLNLHISELGRFIHDFVRIDHGVTGTFLQIDNLLFRKQLFEG